MRSNSVVLPAPLGPMMPTISPWARSNETSSTAADAAEATRTSAAPTCERRRPTRVGVVGAGRRPDRRRPGSATVARPVARASAVRLAVPSARRQARSAPFEEHRAQDVGPLEQLGGRAVEADLALLHEVRACRPGSSATFTDCSTRMIVVPWSRMARTMLEQLLDDHRGEAERQLVDHQQARAATGTPCRARASAAGRPRGCRPGRRGARAAPGTARAPRRRARRGRLWSLRSSQPADPQVLGDGERREHALAAGHLRDARARRSRRAARG